MLRGDTAAALARLLTEDLVARLPAEAVQNRDAFRQRRCFNGASHRSAHHDIIRRARGQSRAAEGSYESVNVAGTAPLACLDSMLKASCASSSFVFASSVACSASSIESLSISMRWLV